MSGEVLVALVVCGDPESGGVVREKSATPAHSSFFFFFFVSTFVHIWRRPGLVPVTAAGQLTSVYSVPRTERLDLDAWRRLRL